MSWLRRAGRWALPTAPARAFFGWALGAHLAVTGVLLGLALRRSDGTLIYVLDDPAIHLSIAENLVHHGTWGVEAGHFQSASSAPLWTVLVGLFALVVPFAADYGALVLNLAASVAVLLVLARRQTALHPSVRRPLHVLAAATVSVVLLFLPAATFVGMEHLLHAALVLVALDAFTRPVGPGASTARRALPYIAVAFASLTRLETAWVAAAIGAALLATCIPRADGGPVPDVRRVIRRVVLLGLAAGLPILAFSLFNNAMGQSWLPNSVVAKSDTLNGTGSELQLREVFDRLTSDAVLAFLTVTCTILAVAGWPERRRWFVPSAAVSLAALAHIVLAQIGWYERYQIYLIALALYAVAVAVADGVRAPRLAARPALAPLAVLALLALSATKISLTVEVPRGVADTYEQRYQAARFLDRYYDDVPVATGELGYISLEHDGPVTDLLGLGDHEVLEARRTYRQRPPKAYWAGLAAERGFDVVAVYPTTLLFDTPQEWILVGTWTIPAAPSPPSTRSSSSGPPVPRRSAR